MIDPDCLIFSDCEIHRVRRFRIIRSLYCIPMRLHSSPGMLSDLLLSQFKVEFQKRIGYSGNLRLESMELGLVSSAAAADLYENSPLYIRFDFSEDIY